MAPRWRGHKTWCGSLAIPSIRRSQGRCQVTWGRNAGTKCRGRWQVPQFSRLRNWGQSRLSPVYPRFIPPSVPGLSPPGLSGSTSGENNDDRPVGPGTFSSPGQILSLPAASLGYDCRQRWDSPHTGWRVPKFLAQIQTVVVTFSSR